MKSQINGTELIKAGYMPGKMMGLALKILKQHFDGMPTANALDLMKKVKEYPENFLDDEILKPLAAAFAEEAAQPAHDTIALSAQSKKYRIYGEACIEEGARTQMDLAMKLPVAVAGALMPDAHQGYGLPIGGVLATRNSIIPYGVGVDIGCRMALTVFDIPEMYFLENETKFKRELIAHTKFGAGSAFHGQYKADHNVLDKKEFNMTPFVKQLHDKAYAQLGTSGGGNHFVEWGILKFLNEDEELKIPKGKYLALLSHSGSRGFGATIAAYYTHVAKNLCRLPKGAVNLAYLDMNSGAGQEYWMAMNLAGDYASACHEVIHKKLTRAIDAGVLAQVENHHNFAWKETWNGEELMIHRKGATPAGKGMMGIIPGSMTAPGYLVRGRGESASINSASHGAGRQMSRTKALQNISKAAMDAELSNHQVTLIGAGLDEAPMAYKDINRVMSFQTELVDILASFSPRIVRMADDGSRED